MGRKAYVVGVGMTKFEKPFTKEWDYPDMAKEAGEKALADAGVSYEEIEQVAVGYCYGDSTTGQRAVYGLGRADALGSGGGAAVCCCRGGGRDDPAARRRSIAVRRGGRQQQCLG